MILQCQIIAGLKSKKDHISEVKGKNLRDNPVASYGKFYLF